MRFLNTTTLTLEDIGCPDNHLPSYAILSHTWGEEEVTFKDIQDIGRAKTMKGYSKLVQACRRARANNYDYIWIDTCCIDKSSSAELSEAINSMFKTYRDADMCYVHLVGVWNDGHPSAESSGFRQCRWFTRSWTLQELLAPLEIAFYSEDWKEIGTKASLQDVITQVTGIPSEVLMNDLDPGEISIAKRMSWAALRKASRDEDIAYSLMGLFGVNMPTIYGEGRNAFFRLQLEIMRLSDDESIFAWTSRGAWKSSGLLAPSPWEFRDCGNICKGYSTSTYSMTNRGLRIQLPLIPCEGRDESWALLGCNKKLEGEEIAPVAIVVKRVEDARDSLAYERVSPHLLHVVRSAPGENVVLQDMYFREKIAATFDGPMRRYQGAYVFTINQSPYAGFYLAKQLPPGCFSVGADPQGRFIIEGHPRQLVALQYINRLTLREFVVFVGIHNLNVWTEIFIDKEMQDYSVERLWESINESVNGSPVQRLRKDRASKFLGDGMQTVSVAIRKNCSPFRCIGRPSKAKEYLVQISLHDASPLPRDALEWTLAIDKLSLAGFFVENAFPAEDWRSLNHDEMVLRLLPQRGSAAEPAILVFRQPIYDIGFWKWYRRFAVVLGMNNEKPWSIFVADVGPEIEDGVGLSFVRVGDDRPNIRQGEKGKEYAETLQLWDGRSVTMKTSFRGWRRFATEFEISNLK